MEYSTNNAWNMNFNNGNANNNNKSNNNRVRAVFAYRNIAVKRPFMLSEIEKQKTEK